MKSIVPFADKACLLVDCSKTIPEKLADVQLQPLLPGECYLVEALDDPLEGTRFALDSKIGEVHTFIAVRTDDGGFVLTTQANEPLPDHWHIIENPNSAALKAPAEDKPVLQTLLEYVERYMGVVLRTNMKLQSELTASIRTIEHLNKQLVSAKAANTELVLLLNAHEKEKGQTLLQVPEAETAPDPGAGPTV